MYKSKNNTPGVNTVGSRSSEPPQFLHKAQHRPHGLAQLDQHSCWLKTNGRDGRQGCWDGTRLAVDGDSNDVIDHGVVVTPNIVSSDIETGGGTERSERERENIWVLDKEHTERALQVAGPNG
ncbi:hypothetical protein ACLB2K_043849 [Fragaria x ananassa]